MNVVGIDIGGTFTDLVGCVDGRIVTSKTSTVPSDPTRGVAGSLNLAHCRIPALDEVLHGSTIAINTVLERKGARTALITTRGFRDTYAIGRGNRIEAFNLFFRRPKPLIARELTFEVTERANAKGEVLVPLAEDEVIQLAASLRTCGVEAVAVCLLHAYANPEHERRIGALLRAAHPDLFVTLSHEIVREYREYERTSTTAINAFVGPRVETYLRRLETYLRDEKFSGNINIMRSNGGVMSIGTAREQPVAMMESGPVAGMIGAGRLATMLGLPRVIGFDMGGTTAKASLITDGAPAIEEGYVIGGEASGQPMQLPVVDIVEVGAGGGSIAWCDATGGLHVGPQSAGADPGPASYGKGAEDPVVTDADFILGRINGERFLNGAMRLDRAAAERAVRQKVAGPLRLGVTEAACGIVRIADAAMSLAVRAVSINKGVDPRQCAMIAFGGAGPLHAVAIAREIFIPKVVVPKVPGTFSALGMLMAPWRQDFVRTLYGMLGRLDAKAVETVFAELSAAARDMVRRDGISEGDVELTFFADLRYVGQEHTLAIPVADAKLLSGDFEPLRVRFDAEHDRRYGQAAPDERIEIVNVRLIVTAPRADTLAERWLTEPWKPEAPVADAARDVIFTDAARPVRTRVVWRPSLAAGARIEGPAVIEEPNATTLVHPGDVATMSEAGHLIIDVALNDFRPRAMNANEAHPITVEVVRNAIVAYADEMANALSKAAYNMMIYEVRDYCCGLIDTKARMISQNRGGLPIFLADLGVAVADGIERYGVDGFAPDDVVVMNQGAVCGQHLNNVVVYSPCFHAGELVGFAANRAHWVDIGGMHQGFGSSNTTDIYAEGLQIRSLKIYETGKRNETLWQIIRDNVRYPDASLGDLRAQIASCQLGARRYAELIARYGRQTVEACVAKVWDQAELAARRVVESIPDGTYEAESFLDNDGRNLGKPLRIKVKVAVRGSTMTVDFTDMNPQVPSPLNSGRSGGIAAARVAFKAITSPDLDVNEGCFRPLEVVLPEGTMLSAKPPAALGRWSIALPTVIDTILKALSPAVPHLVPAAHKGDMGGCSFFGFRPDGTRFLLMNIFGGGWGGRPNEDGESASVSVCQGDVRNTPVELQEIKYPVLIDRHAFRVDSGGAGRYRGGFGLEVAYRLLQPCRANINCERTVDPPWGLHGGQPAATNDAIIRRADGTEQHVLKGTEVEINTGDVVTFLTAGGGGYGDPHERPREAVTRDIAEGVVSAAAASKDYGVNP